MRHSFIQAENDENEFECMSVGVVNVCNKVFVSFSEEWGKVNKRVVKWIQHVIFGFKKKWARRVLRARPYKNHRNTMKFSKKEKADTLHKLKGFTRNAEVPGTKNDLPKRGGTQELQSGGHELIWIPSGEGERGHNMKNGGPELIRVQPYGGGGSEGIQLYNLR